MTMESRANGADFALDELFAGSLKEIPDFPIPGILFKDIAPVLAQPGALKTIVSAFAPLLQTRGADKILAVDARGFVLGAALAAQLGTGFVMVRKPGKLPGAVHSFEYTCEYCEGRLEVTHGNVLPGSRCLVVDDLLATGGTARATADFVYSIDAKVVGFAFLVEIVALNGRNRLHDAPVSSVFRC